MEVKTMIIVAAKMLANLVWEQSKKGGGYFSRDEVVRILKECGLYPMNYVQFEELSKMVQKLIPLSVWKVSLEINPFTEESEYRVSPGWESIPFEPKTSEGA